jgi:hypothetical protein
MQEKYKWSDGTVEFINWYVHGEALRGLQLMTTKTTTKFIHEWLPVHVHPGRAKLMEGWQCPYCEDEVTQKHYLQCPHDKACTLWDKFIINLRDT